MQDAEKYKADTIKVIGCLLNHMDDIPDDELAKHDKATREQVKNGVIQEKLVVAWTNKQLLTLWEVFIFVIFNVELLLFSIIYIFKFIHKLYTLYYFSNNEKIFKRRNHFRCKF